MSEPEKIGNDSSAHGDDSKRRSRWRVLLMWVGIPLLIMIFAVSTCSGLKERYEIINFCHGNESDIITFISMSKNWNEFYCQRLYEIRQSQPDVFWDVLTGNNSCINNKLNGNTPLRNACLRGNFEMARKLIKRGADVNAILDDGITPLILSTNKQEIIHFLLNSGASYDKINVNARNGKGQTALHCSAFAESMCFLISKGADVNTRDNDGKTPLHYAVLRSPYDLVELLIKSGADVNAKDTLGKTPLHYAVSLLSCKPDALLKAGVDVNAVDDMGQTPLHCILINRRAQLNRSAFDSAHHFYRMNEKRYDLSNMCSGEYIRCVPDSTYVDLVKAGADVNLKDKSGKTPLDYADIDVSPRDKAGNILKEFAEKNMKLKNLILDAVKERESSTAEKSSCGNECE